MDQVKKLYRSQSDRMIFGVCGGLARYFQVDPVVVRLSAVILTLFNFLGLVAYIIMAIVVPEEPALPKKEEFSQEDKS